MLANEMAGVKITDFFLVILSIFTPNKIFFYIRKNRNDIYKTLYNLTSQLSNLYNTPQCRVGCRGIIPYTIISPNFNILPWIVKKEFGNSDGQNIVK